MVRDQGLIWLVLGSFHWFSNLTPTYQDLFLPLIPMSRHVDVLLDYDNKQLLQVVATSQVEHHL